MNDYWLANLFEITKPLLFIVIGVALVWKGISDLNQYHKGYGLRYTALKSKGLFGTSPLTPAANYIKATAKKKDRRVLLFESFFQMILGIGSIAFYYLYVK